MKDTGKTDPLDLRILDALQQEVPLVPRPWEEIARRLVIPEKELLKRLERLCRAGIVRGISPTIESRPLGITAATLVALPVAPERIRDVADLISGYPEVSHNFRRDHPYSLWFTISARDEAARERILDEILLRTGFSRDTILNLPTVQKIKIDVRFPIAGNRLEGPHGSA